LYDRLEQTIKQLHSYDEPEIIAVEIVAGSQSYLNWLRQETR
jgi:periplasmic divalent cation tolerance protein